MTGPALSSHPEERYQAELLSTDIGRRTAQVMTWTFVAMLFSIPVLQGAVEVSRHQAPQVFDVVRSRGSTKAFEQALEKASVVKSFVQPRLQAALTAFLRVGNDKAAAGRDGWLFYQPGIDYVAGPDLTDKAYLALAVKKRIDQQGEGDPSPDSRAALLAFHRDCAAAGIRLVVVPIPDKAMLQPGQLTARMASDRPIAPPNNRGYRRLIADLRQQGVDVLDPTPDFIAAGDVRYLRQDTHWTPEFMDTVAAGLARHVDRATTAGPPADRRFELRAAAASRVGDIVDLLKLPERQQIYRPQSITVQQVVDLRTGRLCASGGSPSAVRGRRRAAA